MINELITYIGSMGNITKKTEILEGLGNTTTNINRSIIPVLDKSIDFFKKNEVPIDKLKLTRNMNEYGKLYVINVSTMLIVIRNIFKDIVKNESKLVRLVDDNLEGLISKTNLTVRETAILKVIEDISDMSLYTYDYVYLLINRHPDIVVDGENIYLSKPKINEIYRNLYTYAMMVKTYNDFTKTVSDLGKVADIKIQENSNRSLLKNISSKLGKSMSLPLNGFVGNIIYHWGMFMVDREVKNYESLKDKQKLIELKLLELQSKNNGSENPRLTKQIEYYEEKLKSVEYKIREVEDKI